MSNDGCTPGVEPEEDRFWNDEEIIRSIKAIEKEIENLKYGIEMLKSMLTEEEASGSKERKTLLHTPAREPENPG